MKLIHLNTVELLVEEGKRMHNALQNAQYAARMLEYPDYHIYSVRDDQDQSVMSLSVDRGMCRHIFCANNDEPSGEQVELVSKLLVDLGVAVRHDPLSP